MGQEPEELDSLRRAVRADRRKFRRHVVVGTVLALALAIPFVLVSVATDASPVVTAGLAGLVGGAIAIIGSTRNGRSVKLMDDAGVAVNLPDSADAEARFTNVAFSDRPPTWRGWRRDVGVLVIHPDRIVIDGLNGQMVIDAPFQAVVHDSRWMHWQMVKVTGEIGSERPTAVYLVGRGAPKSKFSADPGDLAEVARHLSQAINDPPAV